MVLSLTVVSGACADGGQAAPRTTAIPDAADASSSSVAPASPPRAPPEPTATSATGVTLETTVAADEVALRIAGPVRRGEVAIVSAKTAVNAVCSVTIKSPAGSAGPDLIPKATDGAGTVSWAWTVEASAMPGAWPVEVSCITASGIRAIAREVLHVE